MAVGVIDHRELMRAIELFGTRVAPEVRKAVDGAFNGSAARPRPSQ